MLKVALLIERGGPKTGCFGGPPRQILVETDRAEQTFALPSVTAANTEAGALSAQAMLDTDYDVQVVLGDLRAQGGDLVVYEAAAADALELPDRLPHADRTTARRLVWRSPAQLESSLTPAALAVKLESGWAGVLDV